jgi:hypothetical protein
MRPRILPLSSSLPRIVRRAYSAPAERLIKVRLQSLFFPLSISAPIPPLPPHIPKSLNPLPKTPTSTSHPKYPNPNTHRSTTSPPRTQAASASSPSPAPPPETQSPSNCCPNYAMLSPPYLQSTKQMALRHRLRKCMVERRGWIRGGRRGL